MKLLSWLRNLIPGHVPPRDRFALTWSCGICGLVGSGSWKRVNKPLEDFTCDNCGASDWRSVPPPARDVQDASLLEKFHEASRELDAVTAQRARLQAYLDNARVMKTLPEDALPCAGVLSVFRPESNLREQRCRACRSAYADHREENGRILCTIGGPLDD